MPRYVIVIIILLQQMPCCVCIDTNLARSRMVRSMKTCVCMYCMCICAYVCMYVCMCVCMCVCVYVCMCVCVWVCVRVCVSERGGGVAIEKSVFNIRVVTPKSSNAPSPRLRSGLAQRVPPRQIAPHGRRRGLHRPLHDPPALLGGVPNLRTRRVFEIRPRRLCR